jgi:hypothetical protein
MPSFRGASTFRAGASALCVAPCSPAAGGRVTRTERALRDLALIAAEIARQQAGMATEQGILEPERCAYKQQRTQCGKYIARWTDVHAHRALRACRQAPSHPD